MFKEYYRDPEPTESPFDEAVSISEAATFVVMQTGLATELAVVGQKHYVVALERIAKNVLRERLPPPRSRVTANPWADA